MAGSRGNWPNGGPGDIQMTNAEKVAEIGQALYGEDWTRGLARLAGVNRRTCQRVRVAALEGEENDQAHGVLAALLEAIWRVYLPHTIAVGRPYTQPPIISIVGTDSKG